MTESLNEIRRESKAEDKIDPSPGPWNGSHTVQKEITKRADHDLLYSQLQLPKEYLVDIQKLAENIRIIAMQKSLQVIGFSSALPNEGVSTTLSHLALVMARRRSQNLETWTNSEQTAVVRRSDYTMRQGILLIDTQFRDPVLHKIFNVDMQNGLYEMLSDEPDAEALIKNTSSVDLKLITVGQKVVSPLIHFDLEKLALLLETIKSKVEFVFLDIPSLLHSADGIAISRLCDGLVLIVRAHETRWEIVEEAKRQLQAAEVNVLGCVLNRRQFFIPEWFYRKL